MKKKILIIFIISALLIGIVIFTNNKKQPYTICSRGSKEEANYVEYTFYLDKSKKYVLKEKSIDLWDYETLSEAIEEEQIFKELCNRLGKDCEVSRNDKIVYKNFTFIHNSEDKVLYIEKMNELENEGYLCEEKEH